MNQLQGHNSTVIRSQLNSYKIRNKMGNTESRSQQVLKYFDRQWQFIQSTPDNTKIYRNKDNDKEAQCHSVVIDNKTNLNKQYDIYNYRRTQDNALVSVYSIQNMKNKSPNLCGNKDILKVMTEHVPYRLNQVPQLDFKEQLYVMSQSMRGFDDCYSKVGNLHINDRMVGINKNGTAKVWLNQNFAQNHPKHQKLVLQTTKSNQYLQDAQKQQQIMVQEVVAMVQRKGRQPFPPDFKSMIHQQSNFVEGYHSIEEYCRMNKVEIPDRIVMNNQQARIFGKNNIAIKEQNQNFSFNHYTPSKAKQNTVFNPGRDTFINNLTQHQSFPQNSIQRINSSNYIQTPVHTRYQPKSHMSQPEHNKISLKPVQSQPPQPQLYQPPPPPPQPQLYQPPPPPPPQPQIYQPLQHQVYQPLQPQVYQPPQLSHQSYTLPHQPVHNSYETVVRSSSPPMSPGGINFSYQSNQRNISPQRNTVYRY